MSKPLSRKKSLFLQTSDTKPLQPPIPSPFHISEPFRERGVWCFWLTADAHVLKFVSHLNCILPPSRITPFNRNVQGRILFVINPRYEHEEAWLWIYGLLESETKYVELDSQWETALDAATEIISDDAEDE